MTDSQVVVANAMSILKSEWPCKGQNYFFHFFHDAPLVVFRKPETPLFIGAPAFHQVTGLQDCPQREARDHHLSAFLKRRE